MAKPRQKVESITSDPATRLDSSAAKVLPDLLDAFRQHLLRETAELVGEERITEEDLRYAYSRLSFDRQHDDPVDVVQLNISRALRENRKFEWASYAMAFVLFIYGLVLLSIGIVHGDIGTRIAALLGGSLAEVLILMPFRFAVNSRKHNIAIRMVGQILTFTQGDPKLAGQLLKETFSRVVLGDVVPASPKKRSRT